MGCTASRPDLEVPHPKSGKEKLLTTKLGEFGREDSVHSNVTENSNIVRAKSWVKDDMGFKAHLAKVNDICELEKKFEMGCILGEGITGQVRLCKSKVDNGVYAMKSLNVSRMDEAQIAELKSEIETLKQLDHPNIINLMEVFESEDNICIIMEHCSGGDLSQRRFETENDVCSVVFQLAEAVAHCHHLGIVHRDLKMENIMFVSKDSDSIRLIDFGLSKKFLSKDEILMNDQLLAQKDKCRMMETACGTAFYMAPEMLTMSYSEKADIWALGVITYMLITGRPPFEGKDEKSVFERVRRGRVTYNEKVWSRLSPEALAFTKSLLTFEPENRPSAKETLELPWLANYQKRRRAIMDGKDGKLFGREVCDALLRFASYPPLKRAALMVVSHHVKEQETRELRNMFLTLDEDHCGELTFEEMFNMIRKYSSSPVTEDNFHNVFDQMDQEKTGKVHYMEFLAATLESRVKSSGQLLNQAFDHLDVESNGKISIDNLQQLLGPNFTRDQCEGLIKKGVHHCQIGEHDAVVTRTEFFLMMGDAQLPSPSPTPTVPDTPTPADTPADTPTAETPTIQSPSPGAETNGHGNGHPLSPPALNNAPPITAAIVTASKISSLRAPALPSLAEEIHGFESRAATPMPTGPLPTVDGGMVRV
jgi:calcium-dependent protein kinase